MFLVALVLLVGLSLEGAESFSTAQLSSSTNGGGGHHHPTRLSVIGMETIGIAVVSAAAGAAAQVPKIQQLEGELEKARGLLEQSREEMAAKIVELEEKLFLMDKAYEDQSAKFMREYEMKKNEEVAKITDKMKTDFKYKLEIKIEKEKSKLLTQKLSEVTLAGDQTTKLAEMKIQMEQLENAKQNVEKALKKSDSELERLGESKNGKKGNFWFF